MPRINNSLVQQPVKESLLFVGKGQKRRQFLLAFGGQPSPEVDDRLPVSHHTGTEGRHELLRDFPLVEIDILE